MRNFNLNKKHLEDFLNQLEITVMDGRLERGPGREQDKTRKLGNAWLVGKCSEIKDHNVGISRACYEFQARYMQ